MNYFLLFGFVLLFLIRTAEMSDVDEAFKIGQDFLKVGGFAFDKIATKLSLVGGTAALIKDIIDIGGRPDPVMGKLNEIGNQINSLSNNMEWQFKSLEAFTVKNDFFRDIGEKNRMLHNYLKHLLQDPNHHNLGLFRDITTRIPPLELARRFIALFEQNETNPLIAAMNADRTRSWATYEKWRKITGDVLTSLLYLETMVNGLFWQRNMIGPNELQQEIYGIYGRLDWLRNNYKETYWNGWDGEKSPVRRLIESIQDDSNLNSVEAKANRIAEGLDAMMTADNHCFYIIVYEKSRDHSFDENGDRLITSFDYNGSNVVIYRSYHFKSASHQDRQKLIDGLESLKRIGYRRNNHGYPNELRKRVPKTGMLGMVLKTDNRVAVQAAKSGAEFGPGWWLTAVSYTTTISRVGPIDHDKDRFILVAGYE